MERSSNCFCLICQRNKADKKGSHLIPAFIISTALSYEGTKRRDYEVMAMTTSTGLTEMFVGRNILPETIRSVTARDIDEHIEDNLNPNVKDFIFCSNCEKRLSILESYFANK